MRTKAARRWRGLVLWPHDFGWDAYRAEECEGLTPRHPGNGCVAEDVPTLELCKAEALDVLRMESMLGERIV